MADSNFVDYVKICCRSGQGGGGSIHFLRTKKTAKGGPDGGNGGRGGHIILRGNKQLWTLLHLKYRKHIMAEDGESGRGQLQTGADGQDQVLDVPLGTVARDVETGEVLFEITNEGEEKILVPGGEGGLGNDHFKSSTRQAPHFSQPGGPRIEKWIVLELKILADVGLVGFPNAGKSTLLSVLSAAKPEIASYPFTTLTPNLGIVAYRDYQSFVMADIPGIIEGAHEGKGLGIRFLRHIERNSILLFVIPADTASIAKEYGILVNELKLFNHELMDKQRVIGISKVDLLDAELLKLVKKEVKAQAKELDHLPVVFFSAHAEKGLTELKDVLWKQIQNGN